MKRTKSFVEQQESAAAGAGAASLSTGALPSFQQSGGGRASTPLDLMNLSQRPLTLSSRDNVHRKDPADAANPISREARISEQLSEQEGKQRRHGHDVNGCEVSNIKEEKVSLSEQTVIHCVGSPDKLTLKEIACGPTDVITERMLAQPHEVSEELKSELREILNGAGGITQREEFINLQSNLVNRRDLSPETLAKADRNQLQILVALKTGIQAFLLPNISVTQSILIEVFFHKRCRNMACQNQLPGDDCTCEVCSTRSGFCNACMCTICSKFDFDVNTCRWIGCDGCSHWTHTDCAIRVGQVTMGVSSKGPGSSPGMVFNCRACKQTSELLGWVKDVFNDCAAYWEAGAIMKEVDCVHRIFLGSEDAKGKKLLRKSEELLEKLKNGVDGRIICGEMQRFFQDLEAEDLQECKGEDVRIVEPQDACSRIAEVVQEALAKMEKVATERARALKRARAALETSSKELEDKKRELQGLQLERQRKKQEIEELEIIVKLKLDESEMFQARADEARSDAEKLQRLVVDKSEKAEKEYTDRYLQLRLKEAEAQHRALFEKIPKIQELLKRASSQKEFSDMKETSGSGL
ncbi:hypothetical protein KP509_18G008400 [Ceratopteris richardii]|uniref:OBERON-like protein n=1 Tax=Ceratopteris richardii TaxID=49495 RepID=A0A8T2SQM1_CERRI|nr:hypothetical protein KP509_18G008400 [Ceratopteris richardii]KAH7365091.1 hypothetical protein KP509_18G008400 [Ceratopteris richardii]